MVLESLTNPASAEKRPAQMFLLGFLYASVAVLLSLWIFYEYSSLVMVFLTVFASVPIVYNTIRYEERKDESIESEKKLLLEHFRGLEVFLFLFVGYSVAYALWYVFLPKLLPLLSPVVNLPEGSVKVLFQTQLETFRSINAGVVGMAAQMGHFVTILLNNLKVMTFCLLFSLIYGLGAIFILAWNASVIGAAMGLYITENLARVTATGWAKAGHYVQIFTVGLFKYSLHGVLEIGAYFMAGMAGGILSIALVRHSFGTRKFERILLDSADLMLIGVLVLVVAAFVEVWVTPAVF